MKTVKLILAQLAITIMIVTMALALAPRFALSDGDDGKSGKVEKHDKYGQGHDRHRGKGKGHDKHHDKHHKKHHKKHHHVLRAPGAPEPSTALLYGLGLLYGGGYFRMRRKK